MHIAKCEGCEKEVEFATYKHDWPKGWMLTGMSRWGKKYHRRSGWAWWCSGCDRHKIRLGEMLDKLPAPVQCVLRRQGKGINILQGYSYPFIDLDRVIAAEARQGREVKVAIRLAGGWAVSSDERLGDCSCLEYKGDDKECPVHGE